ncbi:DUF3050 domain-containing protein [Flavitalea sp. BT771]|uniref:DUF3050 domain-containing protein n=1 Tax=Flavitalea sp. BT771 TaxID=3063329 RepID=UPI0026E43B0F|nr:DUF3050 domain-containing protein [Flavitalea sp. BT771]MDO6429737.1 DUF3050 domain-containing protein [Flavitalea sp. BT771]MDV6218135.1 DUF3050 domain-containing protein [Flavitalea sp. BT771]
MSKQIAALKEALAPTRDRLIAHPVYQRIQSPEALRLFMQHHVFAVWDFMSLLKALQGALTGVSVPWVPVGSANTRYLINEIVVGEESDVDEEGRCTSHFELYLRAMREAGAATDGIERMVREVHGGMPIGDAIQGVKEDAIKEFLEFTFDTITNGEVHSIAAVFTFGREDLIPDMFLRIIADLSNEMPGALHIFKYYLERHIEVDGDHHSNLAMAMVKELCGEDEDKWASATRYAISAIKARIRLWDAVAAAIDKTLAKDGLRIA